MTKTSHQLGAKRLPSAKESRHCHGEQRSCLFQHTVTSDARGHMTGSLAVRLTAAFWDAGFLWSEVGNERSRNQNTDARLSSSDILQWRGNLSIESEETSSHFPLADTLPILKVMKGHHRVIKLFCMLCVPLFFFLFTVFSREKTHLPKG